MKEKETITSNQYGWKFTALGQLFLQYTVPLETRKSHLNRLMVKDSYTFFYQKYNKMIKKRTQLSTFLSLLHASAFSSTKWTQSLDIYNHLKTQQLILQKQISGHTLLHRFSIFNNTCTVSTHSSINYLFNYKTRSNLLFFSNGTLQCISHASI